MHLAISDLDNSDQMSDFLDILCLKISDLDVSHPDQFRHRCSCPDISHHHISEADISALKISHPYMSHTCTDVSDLEISDLDVSDPDVLHLDISDPNLDVSHPYMTQMAFFY